MCSSEWRGRSRDAWHTACRSGVFVCVCVCLCVCVSVCACVCVVCSSYLSPSWGSRRRLWSRRLLHLLHLLQTQENIFYSERTHSKVREHILEQAPAASAASAASAAVRMLLLPAPLLPSFENAFCIMMRTHSVFSPMRYAGLVCLDTFNITQYTFFPA